MKPSLVKPPFWFWLFSAVAFIWYGMSVRQYFSQAFSTDGFTTKYSSEQLDLIVNAPAWAIAAFAIAAFFGFLGSTALLFRKKWAFTMFCISFLGVITEMFHNFFVIKSIAIYGSAAMTLTILIIIFAISFLFFSKFAVNKKWIG